LLNIAIIDVTGLKLRIEAQKGAKNRTFRTLSAPDCSGTLRAQNAVNDGSIFPPFLVYVPGSVGTGAIYDLVWVDREGRESPVTQEKGQYTAPRLSPDGNKLVHSTGAGGTLRIYDFELDSFSRLTFEGTPSGSSEWSPDGEWITFQVSVPGRRHMVRQPADRRTPPEPLTQEQANAQMPTSWSPDGRFLVFNLAAGPGGGWDIFVLEMEQKGEPQPVVSTRANEC